MSPPTRALIPFMRTPPSWPNYFLRFQIPSHWGLELQYMSGGGGGHKHSVYSSGFRRSGQQGNRDTQEGVWQSKGYILLWGMGSQFKSSQKYGNLYSFYSTYFLSPLHPPLQNWCFNIYVQNSHSKYWQFCLRLLKLCYSGNNATEKIKSALSHFHMSPSEATHLCSCLKYLFLFFQTS